MNGSVHSADDILIGFTYMGLAVAVYCIYVPCLIVLRSDTFKTNTCFQIMFHLGVSDLIQIAGHFIFGLWALTGLGYGYIPYWLNKLVGAVFLQLGWYSYIVFVHLLAFNRFLVLAVNEVRYEMLFSNTGTKIWIAACWLVGLVWMAVHLSPGTSMVFTAQTFSYYWDFSLPWTPAVVRASWWNCTINQTMIVMWYVIGIVSLRIEMNDMSAQSREKERALMILATVVGVTLVLSDQYWHTVADFVCPRLPTYCYAIGSVLMMVNNGVNPVCYLAINKKIRAKVFKLVGLKKNEVGPIGTQKSGATTANKRATTTKHK